MIKARTKIVCTIGPTSASPEMLRSLIDAGLDVARINFSHGTHEEHARTVAAIRSLAEEVKRPVAILGDLQGPRIRIGELSQPRMVTDGDTVIFAHEPHAEVGDVPVSYDNLALDVNVGGRILVDDGLLEFEVLAVSGHRVKVRALHGGPIKSHKGMNLPGIDVSAPSLTENDRARSRLPRAQLRPKGRRHTRAEGAPAEGHARRREDREGQRAAPPRGDPPGERCRDGRAR